MTQPHETMMLLEKGLFALLLAPETPSAWEPALQEAFGTASDDSASAVVIAKAWPRATSIHARETVITWALKFAERHVSKFPDGRTRTAFELMLGGLPPEAVIGNEKIIAEREHITDLKMAFIQPWLEPLVLDRGDRRRLQDRVIWCANMALCEIQ